MKLSKLVPKVKKRDNFQQGISELKRYKDRRWISILITAFLFVSAIITWIPTNDSSDVDLIDVAEHTFVKTYLLNKISTSKDAQEWANKYELQTVPEFKFTEDKVVNISNVQILNVIRTPNKIDIFQVGFNFKSTDTSGNIITETQYGQLEVKEIDFTTYIVTKGFEYLNYEYMEPTRDQITFVETYKTDAQSLDLKTVDKKQEEKITKEIDFFYSRYNEDIEQAQLLVSTDLNLPKRQGGTFAEPKVSNIGYYNGNYYAEVTITFMLNNQTGQIEYKYLFAIDEITNKINEINLIN